MCPSVDVNDSLKTRARTLEIHRLGSKKRVAGTVADDTWVYLRVLQEGSKEEGLSRSTRERCNGPDTSVSIAAAYVDRWRAPRGQNRRLSLTSCCGAGVPAYTPTTQGVVLLFVSADRFVGKGTHARFATFRGIYYVQRTSRSWDPVDTRCRAGKDISVDSRSLRRRCRGAFS